MRRSRLSTLSSRTEHESSSGLRRSIGAAAAPAPALAPCAGLEGGGWGRTDLWAPQHGPPVQLRHTLQILLLLRLERRFSANIDTVWPLSYILLDALQTRDRRHVRLQVGIRLQKLGIQ